LKHPFTTLGSTIWHAADLLMADAGPWATATPAHITATSSAATARSTTCCLDAIAAAKSFAAAACFDLSCCFAAEVSHWFL
jgi:hypothetical protein